MSAEEIIDRLKRRFGPGEKPAVRMALYQRLGALAEKDERALYVIAEVADYAERARTNKAHCFCRSVILRLQDHGLLERCEL